MVKNLHLRFSSSVVHAASMLGLILAPGPDFPGKAIQTVGDGESSRLTSSKPTLIDDSTGKTCQLKLNHLPVCHLEGWQKYISRLISLTWLSTYLHHALSVIHPVLFHIWCSSTKNHIWRSQSNGAHIWFNSFHRSYHSWDICRASRASCPPIILCYFLARTCQEVVIGVFIHPYHTSPQARLAMIGTSEFSAILSV